MLIVRIHRPITETQPRESELLRLLVAIDQLRRNVEINPIVALVSVVQRSGRHVEEVLIGQTESVRGGGGDGGSNLINRNPCGYCAGSASTLTINVVDSPTHHYTPRAVRAVMAG